MKIKTTDSDILEVISDLSNDEVFTSPKLANRILDLLPSEIWQNPDLRFLDMGCKTGVFLREISRRLMTGLSNSFPNEVVRLEHIMKNMVFGVAVTELTSFMSRRTLYCSKDASSEFSAVQMPTASGNIWFKQVAHIFVKNKCSECGASSDIEREGRDNYAYGFLHKKARQQILEEFDMKFDVIIGNPPYQMDDAGGHRPVPLYNKFVEQAIALNPRYIAMITPSRWTGGGLGLNEYRATMLADKRIRHFVDFPIASDLFPGVEIKGGVSYFLWDRDNPGLCSMTLIRGDEVSGPVERNFGEHDVLVRDSRAIPILKKVQGTTFSPMSGLIGSVRPFGDELRSNFKKFEKTQSKSASLKIYMNEGSTRQAYFVDRKYVTNNENLIDKWKVFLPTSYGAGEGVPHQVLGQPILGEPGSVCTETYLVIGPFSTESEAKIALNYLKTRFVRFLVSIRKPAQHNVPSTFNWVPIQDWTMNIDDASMKAKYHISNSESIFIESMVREMD